MAFRSLRVVDLGLDTLWNAMVVRLAACLALTASCAFVAWPCGPRKGVRRHAMSDEDLKAWLFTSISTPLHAFNCTKSSLHHVYVHLDPLASMATSHERLLD